jgi:hypothetical protein
MHLRGAFFIDDFHRPGGFLIADQPAVIEQIFDDGAGVPEKRIAQRAFQMLNDAGYAFFGKPRPDRGEEGFGLAVSFLDAVVPEFFLALRSAASSFCALGSARRALLSEIASSANRAVN